MNSLVVILVSFGVAVHAQFPSPGPCPTVSVKTDIDPVKFSGKWYEMEKYQYPIPAGKCIKVTFNDFGFASMVTYAQSTILSTGETRRDEATGFAVSLGPRTTGNSIVVFLPFGGLTTIPIPVQLSILATDHTSYAVGYSCLDLAGFYNFKLAWIWTRSLTPDAAVLNAARNVFTTNNLDKSLLVQTVQTGCDASH